MRGSEENDQYYHAEPAAGVYLHQGQGSLEAVQADPQGKHESQTAEGKERGKMKQMYDVHDVKKVLGIADSKAYEYIRILNAELSKKGFLTVRGRVPRAYFEERFFGLKEAEETCGSIEC